MGEQIDHKAEALVALAAVSELGLSNDEGYRKQEMLTEAQVHATLYLAEQQRIANLIAYANNWYPDSRTEAGDLIHSMIRDGLGIA
jgi:hypothetical protein